MICNNFFVLESERELSDTFEHDSVVGSVLYPPSKLRSCCKVSLRKFSKIFFMVDNNFIMHIENKDLILI